MSHPVEVIRKIRSAGGSIVSTGTDLHISVPEGILSDEDRQILATHKAELVVLLAPDPAPPKDEFDRSIIKTLFVRLAKQAPPGFTTRDLPQWEFDNCEEMCNAAIRSRDQSALFTALVCLEAEILDQHFRFMERQSIQQEDQSPEGSGTFEFTIGGASPKKAKPKPEKPPGPSRRRLPDPQSVLSFAVLDAEVIQHERDMGRQFSPPCRKCGKTNLEPWDLEGTTTWVCRPCGTSTPSN